MWHVVLQVQAFEASVAKDHKQFASTVTNSMTATKKKLVEKFQVIEDLSAKYQQVCAQQGTLMPQLELSF